MNNINDVVNHEIQVIGGILISPENIPKVYEIVKSDDFSVDMHKRIYDTIIGIYAEKGRFDLSDIPPEVLTAEFKNETSKIADSYVHTTNIADYARLVREYSNARSAVRIMEPYVREGINVEITPTINQIAGELTELTSADIHKRIKLEHVGNGMLHGIFEKIAGKREEKDKIEISYSGINSILGGIWKSDLCIIAARPAIGKSAFALNLMYQQLLQGRKAALYSFEMGREQVIQRMLALMSNVKLSDIRDGRVDIESGDMNRLVESVGKLHEMPMYICDSLDVKIPDMAIECRIRGIEVLFVDYLTLTPTVTRHIDTYERVTELARGYKQMAQRLNIPVIVLAQLNRQPEGKTDKRPQLSNLRDSGEIEQAANQVILMSEYQDSILVEIAKNRQGETGKKLMKFDKPKMRFYEIEKKYEDAKTRTVNFEID